jgi:hypothetical protein
MAYTTQNFLDDYNNWQRKSNMSSYDYNLGLANPEIGKQLMSLTDQWHTPGATAEQQALLHNDAEALRKQYGATSTGQYNYSGGADGSQYLPIMPAATATPVTASTPYQSQYSDEISALLARIADYPSFSYDVAAPTYTNRYDPTIQSLLGEIVNRPEFSYNKDEDPNFSAYAKQYRREGELAARDALAMAAARNGGLQTSSSVTAGQQAQNYYASKLSDMIPELYKQAYDRYSNEYQMKRQALGDVYQQEQADYGKYTNALGQYNTDRSFAYSDYANQYNMLNNAVGQYQGQDATEYGRFGDQRAYDTEAARYADSLIQQSFNNAQQTRQLNENTAQQGLENSRYDTEYADLLKQRAVENALNAQNTASLIASRNAAGALGAEDPWDVDPSGAGAPASQVPALGGLGSILGGLIAAGGGSSSAAAGTAKQTGGASAAVLEDIYGRIVNGRAMHITTEKDAAAYLTGLIEAGTLTEAQALQLADRLGLK